MGARHRSKPPNESKVQLPITPMLDMTFQLLFFFIINFNPADQEGLMDMAMPSENITANKESKPDPKASVDKDPLEFPSDVTVKVRTQQDGVNDGDISALFIRNLEGKEEPVEGGLSGLRGVLDRKRQEMTEETKKNIKVQGDGKLKVRSLMRVMDVCRQAGFKNVSMVPPEDFGR
jgi:biopolymer transport protein ExbD